MSVIQSSLNLFSRLSRNQWSPRPSSASKVLPALAVLAAFMVGCTNSGNHSATAPAVVSTVGATTTVSGSLGADAQAALGAEVSKSALSAAQQSGLTLAQTKLRAYGTDGRVIDGTVDAQSSAFSVALPASLRRDYALVFSDDDFQSRVFTVAFPRDAAATAQTILVPSTGSALGRIELGNLSTGSMPRLNRQGGANTDTGNPNTSILVPENNPLSLVDRDGDGTNDLADTDDDQDGTADTAEINPLDPDGDGLIRLFDTDWDNDGIANATDTDDDGDGTADATDTDDDGNGIADGTDTDGDGIPDTIDADDQNTGNAESGSGLVFSGRVLVSVDTDFTAGGTVSVVDLSAANRAATTRQGSVGVELVSSDPVVRAGASRAYVINRFNFNNIQVLDPARGFTTVAQFSVGNLAGETETNTNPYDIVEHGGRLYVCLYAAQQKHVVAFDAATFQEVASFDLSAFLDSATTGVDRVRPVDMALVGDRLYVLCQNMSADFSAAGRARIAVIDLATQAIVDVDGSKSGVQGYELTGRNATSMVYDAGSNTLTVPFSGSFGAAFDGDTATTQDSGIEVLDLNTGLASVVFDNGFDANAADVATRSVTATTESYGVVSGITFNSRARAYVTVAVSFNAYRIVEVNLVSGAVTGTVVDIPAFVAETAMDEEDFLYVTDRTTGAPGIRVFDTLAGNVQRATFTTLNGPASIAVFPGTGR